jgi:hypothetical protein
MAAAGGEWMDRRSTRYGKCSLVTAHEIFICFSLQYMVREHLIEEGQEHLRSFGHGMIGTYITTTALYRLFYVK